MTLKDLKVGESAVVTEVGGQGALRQHFLDMGLIPGAGVKLVKMGILFYCIIFVKAAEKPRH